MFCCLSLFQFFTWFSEVEDKMVEDDDQQQRLVFPRCQSSALDDIIITEKNVYYYVGIDQHKLIE